MFAPDTSGVFGIGFGFDEFYVGKAKESELLTIPQKLLVFRGRNPCVHGALHSFRRRVKLKPLRFSGPEGKLL